MSQNLFSALKMNDLTLNNRIVMAPLTRNRANQDNAPRSLNTLYYQQRASAGLIITEATQVSPDGVGYPATPGIYNKQQETGWHDITNAVHAEGGHIFAQLWYCGRISHPSLLPNQQTPVAPSAIQPEGEAITYEGPQAFVTPRALAVEEIDDIVKQFKLATQVAKAAGFDGVEIHAANGYLIDQFLRDGSNHRDDQYGGSTKNRMRFLNEILDAVCEVWPERVGLRLSPENAFNSMSDSSPQRHFEYFIEQLNSRSLAYLHVLEGDMLSKTAVVNYRTLRDTFKGIYIANNGYDKARAQTALDNGDCDLIAFGMPYISNPDLVNRYKHDLKLTEADQSTLYGGTEVGYTDYPEAKQITEPA